MWHILPMCIVSIISPTLATVQSVDTELQWPGLNSVDSKSPQIDPDTAASVRVSQCPGHHSCWQLLHPDSWTVDTARRVFTLLQG